ncbi:MAG TPA: hypothetical protein VGX68_17895 [Thermoanaerobaculia bacterium]|jgi:hypothetical protein|nr:hypothetical protein [Thermoanaerobaculia bacterium]
MPRLRKLSAFVLALVLTSSAALAKPRHESKTQREMHAVTGTADALVSRLLNWLGGVWTKAGCVIDPDGTCVGGTGTTVPPAVNPVDADSSEGK